MKPNERAVEQIAKLCHEANRIYCESIGDSSQPRWRDAPDWQKVSAVDGVKHILRNPEATPEQSHDNWFNHKLRDGWHYGPVKDPERKTHPCMLPYDQLPPELQMKDTLFRMIALAVAEHLGSNLYT